jgi:hypothetical protein
MMTIHNPEVNTAEALYSLTTLARSIQLRQLYLRSGNIIRVARVASAQLTQNIVRREISRAA